MIIHRVLEVPCQNCGARGQYGNVLVTGNRLLRGCNTCNFQEDIALPRLHKRILYLDQSFFSHAFRGREQPFVQAAARIAALSDQQLLVCPWSAFHEQETRLWRNAAHADLLEFIKRAARRQRFHRPIHIKSFQVQRSFDLYIKDREVSRAVTRSDGLDPSVVEDWDSYYAVDVTLDGPDTNQMRNGKEQAVARLVELFDEWRTASRDFAADYAEEANGYARGLLDLFERRIALMHRLGLEGIMQSPSDSEILHALFRVDDDSLPTADRMIRIERYLASEHFRSTPYIDIMCRVWAHVRRLVRDGQFRNANEARRHLSGVFFDVNAIALFGPYCDAVFVDREMARWLTDPAVSVADRYGFRVFSSASWDDFNGFLDSIQESCSEAMMNLLRIVYG